MINSSTHTKAVIPKVRGTGCTYKGAVNQNGVEPSPAPVPGRNRNAPQKGPARQGFMLEGLEDAASYGFLSINDDTFDNIIKNDNFGEEEDDTDYDVFTHLEETPEASEVFNFRSLYDNLPQNRMLNNTLRERLSNKALHRQTKDETRCIKKTDKDSLKLRSLRNSMESVECGMGYNKRKAF